MAYPLYELISEYGLLALFHSGHSGMGTGMPGGGGLRLKYSNTRLKHKVLFGTDFPLITPERWLGDFEKAGLRDEVKPLILKQNAMQVLGLA